MKTTRRLMPVAVMAALAAFAGGAQASGFQLPENNASGLGNAFAGQAAAAENASTIFWNPAGMTRLPGRQVSGSVSAIKPSAEFSDNGLSRHPLGLPLGPGGSNGGDAGDWAFVPGMYLSWQINPQWWAGIGVTAPFGLATDYDTTFIGRFQSKFAQVKTIDVNPSVAFKLSDAVSLGAGVSYQKMEVKLDRSVLNATGTEIFNQIRVEDENWGFNLGALFTVGTGTRIGITYRSSVEHDLSGTSLLGSIPVLGTAVNGVVAPVELPDTISWGIAHQLDPRWELLGDITYTRWSKIKAVPFTTTSASLAVAAGSTEFFQFQFRDSYRVGVGANWSYRDDLTLKFGLSYDRSPVTDEHRTTFLPDADRIGLAVGAKFKLSKQTTIDVGYMHLFIDDPSIDQRRGVFPVTVNGRLAGNVRGNYEGKVDIFAAQFSYSF